MSEHVFRSKDLKMVGGEIYRLVNQAGEPLWICISQNRTPLEEIMIRLLREVVER